MMRFERELWLAALFISAAANVVFVFGLLEAGSGSQRSELPVLKPVEEMYPTLASHALECEQCGDRVYRDKIAALCEEGDKLFKQDFAERWKKLKDSER
jgi:hypothetical protein